MLDELHKLRLEIKSERQKQRKSETQAAIHDTKAVELLTEHDRLMRTLIKEGILAK